MPPAFPDPLLRTAMAAASGPMLLVAGGDGHVLAANPAATLFFGRTEGELLGRPLPDLAVRPAQMRDALSERRKRLPMAYLQHASGKHLPAELQFHWTETADATCGVVTLNDLTERIATDRRERNADRAHSGIFGAAPYPILVVNAAQEVVDANDAALALYGFAAHEMDGSLRLPQLVADAAMLKRYLQPGVRQLPPHRHWTRAGTEFTATASVALTRQNHASAWIVVVRNVTEEEATLAALHASEERWRFALEGHGGGVWEWNPESDEFYVSRGFSEMLDLADDLPASFAGWERLVHPDDIPAAQKSILSHLAAETPLIDLEIRLRDGGGRYHWVELRAKAMGRDAFGRTRRVVGTVRIVDDERARRESEREQVGQMLHISRLASMGELATLIAHELNQPLTAISNFAGAALRQVERDPEAARRPLELIQFAVQNAATIVRRVRGFAQKEPGQSADLDLNRTIVEILGFVEADARAAGVGIAMELAVGLPTLSGDKVQIGQLVLNLVKNAIDALRDSPAPRSLFLRTDRPEPAVLRLQVEDNGPGLPASLREELFQPFFTTKTDGVGIGLSICRSIVENHAGALEAASLDPRGTRFTVRLPLR